MPAALPGLKSTGHVIFLSKLSASCRRNTGHKMQVRMPITQSRGLLRPSHRPHPRTQGERMIPPTHEIGKNGFQSELVSRGPSDLEWSWRWGLERLMSSCYQRSISRPRQDFAKPSLGPPNKTVGRRAGEVLRPPL